MKPTKKDLGVTSFHGCVFTATVNDLRKILGEPAYEQNDGEDKVNFEWEMETEQGTVFTVYDWKEYRRIREDEKIEWHIGSDSPIESGMAGVEINEALAKLETAE